jgi:hypothetical protein
MITLVNSVEGVSLNSSSVIGIDSNNLVFYSASPNIKSLNLQSGSVVDYGISITGTILTFLSAGPSAIVGNLNNLGSPGLVELKTGYAIRFTPTGQCGTLYDSKNNKSISVINGIQSYSSSSLYVTDLTSCSTISVPITWINSSNGVFSESINSIGYNSDKGTFVCTIASGFSTSSFSPPYRIVEFDYTGTKLNEGSSSTFIGSKTSGLIISSFYNSGVFFSTPDVNSANGSYTKIRADLTVTDSDYMEIGDVSFVGDSTSGYIYAQNGTASSLLINLQASSIEFFPVPDGFLNPNNIPCIRDPYLVSNSGQVFMISPNQPVVSTTEFQNPIGSDISSRVIMLRDYGSHSYVYLDKTQPGGSNSIALTNGNYIEVAISGGSADLRYLEI